MRACVVSCLLLPCCCKGCHPLQCAALSTGAVARMGFAVRAQEGRLGACSEGGGGLSGIIKFRGGTAATRQSIAARRRGGRVVFPVRRGAFVLKGGRRWRWWGGRGCCCRRASTGRSAVQRSAALALDGKIVIPPLAEPALQVHHVAKPRIQQLVACLEAARMQAGVGGVCAQRGPSSSSTDACMCPPTRLVDPPIPPPYTTSPSPSLARPAPPMRPHLRVSLPNARSGSAACLPVEATRTMVSRVPPTAQAMMTGGGGWRVAGRGGAGGGGWAESKAGREAGGQAGTQACARQPASQADRQQMGRPPRPAHAGARAHPSCACCRPGPCSCLQGTLGRARWRASPAQPSPSGRRGGVERVGRVWGGQEDGGGGRGGVWIWWARDIRGGRRGGLCDGAVTRAGGQTRLFDVVPQLVAGGESVHRHVDSACPPGGAGGAEGGVLRGAGRARERAAAARGHAPASGLPPPPPTLACPHPLPPHPPTPPAMCASA